MTMSLSISLAIEMPLILYYAIPVWIALARQKSKDQVSRALGQKEVPHSTVPSSLWTSNVSKPHGQK